MRGLGTGAGRVRLGIVTGNDTRKTQVDWRPQALICNYATFTENSQYPRVGSRNSTISCNGDEWFPWASWGRAAGMGFSATQSATLLQEDLWLFCFVYLSVCILTVIWTADSLGPISLLLRVASAPCFLFGSFDSLNFHLSSLPLFLQLLMGHLTALGDQENWKPESVCFLSHLPPPQRDVPVCFFFKWTKYIYVLFFTIWRNSGVD